MGSVKIKRTQTFDEQVSFNVQEQQRNKFNKFTCIDRENRDLVNDLPERRYFSSLGTDRQPSTGRQDGKTKIQTDDQEDHDQNQSESDNESQQLETKVKSGVFLGRWKKINNVAVGVLRLQTNEVKSIDHPQDIVHEMQSFNICNIDSTRIIKTTKKLDVKANHMKANSGIFDNFINDFRQAEKFVKYSESGGDLDILKMQKIINNDKKQFLRETDDPEHLLNKLDKHGQNAYYIACKNGNLNVLKLLLLNKANPHIKSKLRENILQSPMEVAIRWNHKHCIEWMIENIKYTNKDLKKFAQLTGNVEMKQILLKKMHPSQNWWVCCQ